MHRAIVHASTFGMGNMAMVAALALKVLDEENLERVP
jgi:ornithine--oxo-acid transaminase